MDGIQEIDAQAVASAFDRLTVNGLIGAAFVLLIGLAVIRVVMHLVQRMFDRLPFDRTLEGFLSACVKIVMYIVLGTMVADKLGIPVTSLVALLSLFALAVSLSVQNMLANVVSGVMILTARLFAAGDYIETEKAAGTVQSVDLMYTHLSTPDNKKVLVPNSELSSGQITNYSANALRRVDIPVRVGYEHSNQAVIAALLRAAEKVDGVEHGEKPPTVFVAAYGEAGAEFSLRVWTRGSLYWTVQQALMLCVREELAADGIRLTYGARQVTVREETEK